MKNFSILLKVLIFCFLLEGGKNACSEIPKQVLIISTGSRYGSYYEIGRHLCAILDQKESQYSFACLNRASEGSTQNIEIVLSDNTNTSIGIAQSDVLLKSPRKDDLRAVAFLFEEPIFIMASQNSSATDFNDVLLQKKVNIGSAGSGSNSTIKSIFTAKGWVRDDLIQAGNYEIISLICKNDIDVAFFLYANPSSVIANIIKKCEAKIIGMQEDFIQKACNEIPGIKPYTIKGKLYDTNPEDVKTVAARAILFTSKDASSELIYNILDGAFQKNAIIEANPLLKNMKLREFFENPDSLPLHPGAEKFYNQYKSQEK